MRTEHQVAQKIKKLASSVEAFNLNLKLKQSSYDRHSGTESMRCRRSSQGTLWHRDERLCRVSVCNEFQ